MNTPETEVVSFGMELHGATREQRIAEYNANWNKAEEAAKAGKTICLTDLMCQAEQLHLEKPKRTRQTRLQKLIAQARANTAPTTP